MLIINSSNAQRAVNQKKKIVTQPKNGTVRNLKAYSVVRKLELNPRNNRLTLPQRWKTQIFGEFGFDIT